MEDLRAALEQVGEIAGDLAGGGGGDGRVKSRRTGVRILQAGRKELLRIWLSIGRFVGFILKKDGRWWIVLIVVTVAAGVGLSWRFREILHSDEDSLSTTISNLSFVVGGIVAIELALWRSIVGERQTAVAQHQAETAQRGLLNERFQKGAEMLGSENLSVRLGGIYALKHLAAEHPEQYHVQVMELLCAFVRHPTRDKSGSANLNEERQFPRADVSAVAEMICKRDDSHLLLEQITGFKLDLNDADLRRISLINADLTGASLLGVNLSYASLILANLTNAQLAGAVFSELLPPTECQSDEARSEAVQSMALIRGANFSGADFSFNNWLPAEGLSQRALDKACADPSNEPKLEGVIDARTGNLIVWQGSPCEDE